MRLKKPQKNTPRAIPYPPLRKMHFSLRQAMTPVQQWLCIGIFATFA